MTIINENDLADDLKLFEIEIIFLYEDIKHIFPNISKEQLLKIIKDNIFNLQDIVQEECTSAVEDYLFTIENDDENQIIENTVKKIVEKEQNNFGG